MPTLVPAYDTWLVLASVLIAGLASYVALDLARRVRDPDPKVAVAWGLGGSVALGTGIWAMHFVGMLAFSLPIALGYGYALTALSWAAAVAVSGVALALASRGRLTGARLAGGAMTMGAGICAMHYTGMAALDMQPGIVWDWGWVALSGLVAVAASASALVIFSWLRHAAERRHGAQAAAAAIMGLAIAGMHYTGMAAAGFPQGSVCLSAGALGGSGLAAAVVGASAALLLATLLTSILDGRLRSHSARLALSLQAANAELLAANAELKTLAFRDPLTGLPNRLLFEDRLRLAVARVDRLGGAHRLAVLFVDLDGFKPINDSLGHAQGDRVLCEAARRLRLATRETDSVARVGGDEFVLALETHGDAEESGRMAQRLVAELGAPQDLAGRRFSISASIGIAVYPDDGAADKLLAHADAAMYAAKRGGGGSCMRFEPDMADDASEQLGLQHDLRGAIERQQLSLHYQPKVDARTGELRGVEALLRWQHPTLGAVSPGVFIPLAERFGLIGALGDWVIDEACRQMDEWAAAGLRQRVAINVSVHQLRHDGLVGHIEDALRRHRLDPADLLCEITESHSMDDLPHGGRVFDELLRIGVFLSIDDFGTGHSSLSRLRQLPARQLKIDRSFVAGLELGDDAAALVRAMVGMAHALGLCVVAEGVETEAQRRRLAQLGCDELQGYLLARPMPAAALPGWIAGRSGQRFADEVEPVLAEVKL